MKIVAILGAVLAVAAGAILLVAALKPDSFRIQRTASIKAPPERVFALVNDFRRWTEWSPWENIDPALKRSYEGAQSGKGAAYGWEGNKNVGSGRMEILESAPGSRITIKLDFLKPFEAHNTAQFEFDQSGDTTIVTWAMFGPSPYVSRLMGLVFDMDGMVGSQFERGLATLKAKSES